VRRRADFSSHFFNNYRSEYLKDKKGRARSGNFGLWIRAPQQVGSSIGILIFTMASGWLQRSEAFFVFNGSVLSLVWSEFLRLSAMLERAGLLLLGVPPFGERSSPSRSAETLPPKAQRKESSSARGEPPPTPVEQTE
jgi:hypothetical protein